jgi:protein NrfD
VALGIYTGVLLSALGARPLWSSGLLGPLFLVSGLSTAAAFGHWASPEPEERVQLAWLDNLFLSVELALIVLLLVGLLTSTAASAEAARLLLGGPYTAVFWVVVVGLGIVLPLIVQSLAVTHRIRHTPLAPLLVMAGGLALRFVLVSAGQASHWHRLL